MGKICEMCGKSVLNKDTKCPYCGYEFETPSYCRIHGVKLESDGKCELCEKEKKDEEKTNLLLKTTKVLIGVFVILVVVQFGKGYLNFNIINSILGKNVQTTSDVFITNIKMVNKLQTYRINKADFYTLNDDEKKPSELIIRYFISATFDLDMAKIDKNNDGSLSIKLPQPEIEASSKEYNEEGKYGVEIFYQSTKYGIGELNDVANKYIEEQKNKYKHECARLAFVNLEEKIVDWANKYNVNILEIEMEEE